MGILTRERVEQVPPESRAGWTVAEAQSGEAPNGDLRVLVDDSLNVLIASTGLQRQGAVMAVDHDGVLRGVVTVNHVRRALRDTLPAS
jgi:hypothetical protein